MFEVEVSRIDPLRNLVKALSVIVEEGTFTMNEAQNQASSDGPEPRRDG